MRDVPPILPGENAAPSERGWDLGPGDYVLGVLTLPLLAFLLMFVTSRMSESLHDRGYRTRLLLTLLVVEAVAVGAVVWAVTS